MSRRSAVWAALAAMLTVVVPTACATTTQFDRFLNEGRWADAARVLSADSSLLNDEHALYAAAFLYGTAGRPTFDPVIASDLLRRFLSRFPQSSHQNEALDRLALLDQILQARRDVQARERQLTIEIEALTADTRLLRVRLDSITMQSDQLRRNTTRLEAELRDRDEQLRTLRRELQRLKEIDLKPRPPASVIKP